MRITTKKISEVLDFVNTSGTMPRGLKVDVSQSSVYGTTSLQIIGASGSPLEEKIFETAKGAYEYARTNRHGLNVLAWTHAIHLADGTPVLSLDGRVQVSRQPSEKPEHRYLYTLSISSEGTLNETEGRVTSHSIHVIASYAASVR